MDLKASNIGVLLTDHNGREALSVTDRIYIVSEGRIVGAGTPSQLGSDPELKKSCLGESSGEAHQNIWTRLLR